ncbi:hypothetical protein JX580_00715 [Thiomicrospira microaerophila]|uniref:hypothetical protein n=1 Tax=Thiomicrospira microaerophila TaxID=406020 RepID=UPI00200D7D4B|nr:hypothetical protein [Thiomicrospira microaerophila]UQB42471.1 hypothetical protein JX580_00715 [Thiomicrospira microaerophila]
MIRPRRFNSRRYYRYEGEFRHHFIRIGNHETKDELPGDIYSSGIQHFTRIMNERLDKVSRLYVKNLEESLLEKHPDAFEMFMTILGNIEALRDLLNKISLGKIQINESIRFIQDILDTPISYDVLRANARTEAIVHNFEQKLVQLLNAVLKLLKNSTPHEIYQGGFLEKLQIDYEIRGYIDKLKLKEVKFLRALVNLYHYIALLEKIYNHIANSSFILVFPEYWEENYVNISCGGIGIYTDYLVKVNDILEVLLRFNTSTDPRYEDYEIIHQRAKVLRIEEDKARGQYLLACQFILCPKKTMDLISNSIQAREVIHAYNAAELLGSDMDFNQPH